MKLTYDEKYIVKETLRRRKEYLDKKLCYTTAREDIRWINAEIEELEKIINKFEKEILRKINTTDWLPF